MRVLAAMSGGVDSAVAAARAVTAGHDVVGVHLALSETPDALRTGSRGCCSKEDAADARRAADVLGIPFYVWDFAGRFAEEVVDQFVEDYAAGRTPNPCLRCNEKIKFAALLDKALALGFDAVCTGHYAQLSHEADDSADRSADGSTDGSADGSTDGSTDGRTDGDGRTRGRAVLRRAVDAGKDQSYVLAVLSADQLAHAMFPVGDTPKARIRAEAAERGLSVAAKPDSHDICFIPTGDTAGWLAERLGERPGPVVDAASGAVLGEHTGVHGFTVGQRRGLGVSQPAADGRPRYVLAIEPVSGTVRVGPSEALDVHEIVGERPVWASGRAPDGPVECVAQVRAHGGLADAVAELDGQLLRVHLREPLRGVAPGQAVALYRPDAAGDIVLGSATIR